jgi:hypothetical protein
MTNELKDELHELIAKIELEGLISTRSATARLVASLRQVIQACADETPEVQDAVVCVAKALYAEIKFMHSAHYQPPVHRRPDGTIVPRTRQ